MNDRDTKPTGARLGLTVERVWVWRDANGATQCLIGARPNDDAVEYMRVMSREEVEKLAFSEEGIDPQQLINSMTRTIEGQRRDINRLKEKLTALNGVTK